MEEDYLINVEIIVEDLNETTLNAYGLTKIGYFLANNDIQYFVNKTGDLFIYNKKIMSSYGLSARAKKVIQLEYNIKEGFEKYNGVRLLYKMGCPISDVLISIENFFYDNLDEDIEDSKKNIIKDALLVYYDYYKKKKGLL